MPHTHQKLYIIDALGPFVEPTDQEMINWSKVNFSQLESNNRLSKEVQLRIEKRFTLFAGKIEQLGYTALSIDDLAHLVSFSWYHPHLQQLIQDYQQLYKNLFTIAKQHHLKVFINTDYLFFNDDIKQRLHKTTHKKLFADMLTMAFKTFPEIDGLILRIGENDGKDVEGDFLSTLLLKTPHQANALLKSILPLFEKHNKTLIFRTWTVGVYKIGDLIWNPRTYNTVFSSVHSDALIISMKFGDTDFMRYLHLNPQLFEGNHKKIIELQTRREWEGMGLYPSFVGWDYANYHQQLSNNKTIVGMHVWCQTGGWAKKTWSNVTYLHDSSFWNELNTFITIKIYRDSCTVEQAIALFCKEYSIENTAEFIKLLELSEIAIKKGLYIRELAEQKRYFRRSRVPTLLWLTWDKILLQPLALWVIRSLVSRPDIAIQEAKEVATVTSQMIAIARKIKLPQPAIDSLLFQKATFTLFIDIKKYVLHQNPPADLQAKIDTYTVAFPEHYTIPNIEQPGSFKKTYLSSSALTFILRTTALYRKRDKVFLATSPLQRKIVKLYLKKTKSPLSNQSMGVDVLFK